MRATISFETDVSKVEATMKALIKTETDDIRDIAHKIETSQEHTIEKVLSDCLQDLYRITNQLQQYKTMFESFGKARYETMLPQPAPASIPVESAPLADKRQATLEAARNIEGLQETLRAMNEFGSFVDKINNQTQEEEESDGLQAQEG